MQTSRHTEPAAEPDLYSPDTFSDVYGRYHPHVRAIARRHLRDEAEAEDLVQDVFLQAWRQFNRFDATRADMQGWLAVIARSRALDRLRRRTVRQRTERALEHPVGLNDRDPWLEAELRSSSARVRAALSSVPLPLRHVVDLAYTADLSQRQIAARLGETLGVVKSRLKQGLAALRDELAAASRQDAGLDAEPAEQALTTDDLAPVPDSRRSPSPPMPSLSGIQVLVVDDDRRTRELLQAVLEHAGALIVMQPSAADACRTLESVWPDVLLADISMPGGDGFALMRHVHHLEQAAGLHLPAVALTGLGSEFDRSRVLAAGFRTHLAKPVHPSAVLVALAQVVGLAAPADRRR